jgi:hypothetical protein
VGSGTNQVELLSRTGVIGGYKDAGVFSTWGDEKAFKETRLLVEAKGVWISEKNRDAVSHGIA